jgi:hypothetical protein
VSAAREREEEAAKEEPRAYEPSTGLSRKAARKEQYDTAESRLAASEDVFVPPPKATPSPPAEDQAALTVDAALVSPLSPPAISLEKECNATQQ